MFGQWYIFTIFYHFLAEIYPPENWQLRKFVSFMTDWKFWPEMADFFFLWEICFFNTILKPSWRFFWKKSEIAHKTCFYSNFTCFFRPIFPFFEKKKNEKNFVFFKFRVLLEFMTHFGQKKVKSATRTKRWLKSMQKYIFMMFFQKKGLNFFLEA